MTRAAERERDEDEGIVDIGSLFGTFPRGKKVEKYDENQPRDDSGKWTDGTGANTPMKTVGEVQVGDRVWSPATYPKPAVVTEIIHGTGRLSNEITVKTDDGHSRSAPPYENAHLIREHSSWLENSTVVPKVFFDWYGIRDPNLRDYGLSDYAKGTNKTAADWRGRLNNDDKRLIEYWMKDFANVHAMRANPDDSAVKHFVDLVKSAPSADTVYRGTANDHTDWKASIGRTLQVTTLTSGSTDKTMAAAFSHVPGAEIDFGPNRSAEPTLMFEIHGEGAHLIGNNVDEAVVLPGAYRVAAVRTESIEPEMLLHDPEDHSGRDMGEHDFQVVTLERTGDAPLKATKEPAAWEFKLEKAEGGYERFLLHPDEWEWVDVVKYDDDEPRDDRGEWTAGDESGGETAEHGAFASTDDRSAGTTPKADTGQWTKGDYAQRTVTSDAGKLDMTLGKTQERADSVAKAVATWLGIKAPIIGLHLTRHSFEMQTDQILPPNGLASSSQGRADLAPKAVFQLADPHYPNLFTVIHEVCHQLDPNISALARPLVAHAYEGCVDALAAGFCKEQLLPATIDATMVGRRGEDDTDRIVRTMQYNDYAANAIAALRSGGYQPNQIKEGLMIALKEGKDATMTVLGQGKGTDKDIKWYLDGMSEPIPPPPPPYVAPEKPKPWGSGPDGMGPTLDHPDVAYHLTRSVNRDSIADKGLEANRSLGGKNTRIYLAFDKWTNENKWDTVERDVLTVNVKGIPLRPDPELPDKWAIAEVDISPDRIGINKYSPDQERDARGRFGSGDGGDGSSADEHGAFTGTSKWADAGPRISPHYAQPEPLPPSGRGTPRPENPHATELPGLSKEQSAAVVASVLAASPDKAHPLTMEQTVKNLVGQYKEMVDPKSDNYDPQSEKDGKPWYPVAHEVGRDMAALSGVSVRQAIGMIAATSPQCQWDQNRAIAEYMNRKLSEDKPLKDVNEQILDALRTEHGVVIHNGQKLSEMTPKEAAWALKTIGQTQDNLRCLPITKSGDLTKVGFVSASVNMAKAIRIFRGADPDKVLGGHKVRSFFNNIADPDNAVDVTIDTHAISAAALYDMPTSSQEIKDLLEIGKSKSDNVVGNYAFFADAYREAARQVGEIPSVFQAQLWLHWSGSDQPGGWKGTSDQYPKAKPTATAAARQRRLNQRANKSEASEAEQAIAEMDWFNKLVVRIGHPEWAAWDYGKDLSDEATIVKGNPNHDAEGRFSSGDDDDSDDDEASTDGFQSRLGRCYELAGRFAMDSDPKGDVKVVHGSIQGAGAPRIGHAWNILADGTIHDPVLNQNFSPEVHQQFFHAISDHVYTAPEAVMQMLKTRHFGPWETPEIEKYADDEPRDEAGRWESGGGTPTASGDHEETGAFLGTDENNGTDGLEKPMMYAPVVDLPPLTDGTVRTQDLKVGDKIMADDGTTKEVAFKTANTADLKLARGWPITGLRYDVTFTDGTTQKLLDTAVHTLAGDDGKPLVVATPEPPAPVTPAPAPVEYKVLPVGGVVSLQPGDRIFHFDNGSSWRERIAVIHSDGSTTTYSHGGIENSKGTLMPPLSISAYADMGYKELQPYDLPPAPPAYSGPDKFVVLPDDGIARIKEGDRLFIGRNVSAGSIIAHTNDTYTMYINGREATVPAAIPTTINMTPRDWSEAIDVADVKFLTLQAGVGHTFWNAVIRPGDKIYAVKDTLPPGTVRSENSVVIQRAMVDPNASSRQRYAGVDAMAGPTLLQPDNLAANYSLMDPLHFAPWQPEALAPPVIRSDVTPAIREAGARFLISSPQFEDAAFAGAPELRAAIDFERAGYATVGAFATDKLLEAKAHGTIRTSTTGQQDKLDDLITVLKTATKPADIKGQSAIAKMARERMKSGAKLQAMGEQARSAMSYLDAVGVAVANHTDIPSPPKFMSGMPVKEMTDAVTAFVDNKRDSLFGKGTNMPVNINDIAVHEKIMEVGRKVAAAIDADPHIVSLRKQLDERLEVKATVAKEKTEAWNALQDAREALGRIEDKGFEPHKAEFEALRSTNWQAAVAFRRGILDATKKTPEHIAANKAITEAYDQYEWLNRRSRLETSTSGIKALLDRTYYDTTIKELDKYQEMGGGQKFNANQVGFSSKEAIATLNEALSLYPTSWVNRAANRTAERPFSVTLSRVRGGFTDGDRMWLSPDSSSIGNAVATHEAGHMMERAVPGLTNAEAVHFLTRTMMATGGRGVIQSLKQLTGVNYRSDEKATPDEFVNGYQGKRYDDWTARGRAASAELFTHGIQCVMHPTTQNGGMVGLPLPEGLRDKSARNEDRESRVFVLGALATLNPPAVPPTGTYRTEDRMAEVDNG